MATQGYVGLHRVTWGSMHEVICALDYTWGYTGLLKATQGYMGLYAQGYRGLHMVTQGYRVLPAEI